MSKYETRKDSAAARANVLARKEARRVKYLPSTIYRAVEPIQAQSR